MYAMIMDPHLPSTKTPVLCPHQSTINIHTDRSWGIDPFTLTLLKIKKNMSSPSENPVCGALRKPSTFFSQLD